VAILVSPELKFKKSVRVLASLESLVGQLNEGTSLQVINTTTVFNLEDKIANARLQVEPAIDRSTSVFNNAGQV
jgi:hypothetical protein